MEFAIYKAEDKGANRSRQIEHAAEALRKERPDIPSDEALIHATELFERLADKQEKRRQYNERRKEIKRKSDSKRDLAAIYEQQRREVSRAKVRRDFFECGNCGRELHRSAKGCPHCAFPWPKRNNHQTCNACRKQTPIYVRRKYTRINKWDKIKHCIHCGKHESIFDDADLGQDWRRGCARREFRCR